MATRAERFKSTTARHGQEAEPGSKAGKQKRTPSPAKRLARLAPPEERRYGGTSTAARNRSLGRKAVYSLEDSATPKRPSRKSTRSGGKNRVKAATPLTSRQKLKVTSPSAQHQRRG